jgi:GTP-binding protein Era
MLNRPGVQIAFVDTPGLHLGEKRALNRAMNRTAASALADADVVVFVVEGMRFYEEDEAVLQRIRESGRNSIAVINKVDLIYPKDQLLPFTAELAGKHGFLDVVPVSAEKGVNLDRLIDVAARLPESPELFPPEQRTDRGEDFQISETIREKLTMELVEGCPMASRSKSKEGEVEGRLVIDAVIWVDRAGRSPSSSAPRVRASRIGQRARESSMPGSANDFTSTWVKVREDWAATPGAARNG